MKVFLLIVAMLLIVINLAAGPPPATRQPLAFTMQIDEQSEAQVLLRDLLIQGLVQCEKFYPPTPLDKETLFVDALSVENSGGGGLAVAFSVGVAFKSGDSYIAIYRMSYVLTTTLERISKEGANFLTLWESVNYAMQDEIGDMKSRLKSFCKPTEEAEKLWTSNSKCVLMTSALLGNDAFDIQPIQ